MLLFFLLVFSIAFPSSASMQARNTIEGRVTTSDGRAVSNAQVTLQNDAYSPVGSGYTDAAGRFRFFNLVSGNYVIVIEAGTGTVDFERQSQRVEARAFNERPGGGGGEVFRADFVVKPRNISGPVGSSSNALVFHQDIPENAKKEFERGMKSFEKNDFNGAAQALKKAIEIFPDYYDALEVLGTEYVKHNDYNSALPLLEKAVAVNKDGWRGFYSLGIAQLEMKQRGEGIKSLKRAAELNPESPNVNMRLGMALAVDDDARAEAIQAFERVRKSAKDSIPNVYFYLGALYSRNNQYKEASDAWETFLKLYPQTPEKENIKKMIEQFRQKAKAQGAK